MICPACGAEITEGLKFCENCGAPLETAAPAGAPVPPTQTGADFQSTDEGAVAPGTAFALVIVGLVLSVLFVTFIPGLICCIVGLVLNAGYTKKGLVNRRKTSTTVIGVIGIVVAVLCAVAAIVIGVITAQAVNEIDRQGIDITTESVEVTTDSSGRLSIRMIDSSASAASSQSSDSSASSSSSAASSASSASSPAATSIYEDEKYHDYDYNPTLYSLMELDGGALSNLLASYNYQWDPDYNAWAAPGGSLLGAVDMSGDMSRSSIAALPQGAAGQPVAIFLLAEGYASPSTAFNMLTKDVVVEDKFSYDGGILAVVHGSPMVRHLVAIVPIVDEEQVCMVFTEEAISSGLFAQIIGEDAGSSMDAVWQTVTGGFHIGSYLQG